MSTRTPSPPSGASEQQRQQQQQQQLSSPSSVSATAFDSRPLSGAASTAAANSTAAATSSSNVVSHVECATYPIPQPLAQRLQLAVAQQQQLGHNNMNNENPIMIMETESIHDALSGLVGNSIEALDALYFSQSPTIRQSPYFQHRLCLRVAYDTIKQTLTLTDLGIGMTRADLINCLGIGRNLSPIVFKSGAAAGRQKQKQRQGTTADAMEDAAADDETGATSCDDDDDDDDSSTESSDYNIDGDDQERSNATYSTEEEDDYNDDADEDDEDYIDDGEVRNHKKKNQVELPGPIAMDSNNNNNNPAAVAMITPAATAATTNTTNTTVGQSRTASTPKSTTNNSIIISCKSKALGGFYAALCTLGIGVTVQTKSNFDDYYELQIGQTVVPNDKDMNSNPEQTSASSFDSFQIKRPYPEGTILSVANGFHLFENIRGESGTSIIIQLNKKAIGAGLLSDEVIKPLFLKIVETTQYTVAFSSDSIQAQEIIEASAKEMEALVQQQKQGDNTMTTTTTGENNNMDTSLEDIEMVDAFTNISPPTSAAIETVSVSVPTYNINIMDSVKERAKYIPLRLSLSERKVLRLVEATMNCCDYTTQVDKDFRVVTGGSTSSSSPSNNASSISARAVAARRTHEQLRGVSSILHGVVTACDYSAGKKLVTEHNFGDYETFYQMIFEIARRHKIMNPEKMRTEYGKLIYLLQDAVSPIIQQQLGFSVIQPINTVYRFLEQRGGLDLLSDPHIERATEEILAGPGKSRAKIDTEIRQKERAVQHLKKKYRTSQLSSEDIHLCLYSICDNNSFLNSNRVPIDKVIDYLTTHFASNIIEDGYSLSIISGEDGARLSHSHERQYYFALQSLTLWRNIINDMFRLWAMAEEDLLSETVLYSLQDTGQGMQRVQQSPRTYRAMQQILQRVQKQVQNWVGSSVIHMGDHNVPNALSFIDKYTQVPRILGPIVTCLEVLEQLCEKDKGIEKMINNGFGGLEKLRKDILYDFFRSAFDGSGADNFYDAGSCIDGRLTSAWNWCSQLPDKPFYPIFKLTGFIGFDGEFQ